MADTVITLWVRAQLNVCIAAAAASIYNLAGNRLASAYSRLIWDMTRPHYAFMPNEKVTCQGNGEQQSGMWGCQAPRFRMPEDNIAVRALSPSSLLFEYVKKKKKKSKSILI